MTLNHYVFGTQSSSCWLKLPSHSHSHSQETVREREILESNFSCCLASSPLTDCLLSQLSTGTFAAWLNPVACLFHFFPSFSSFLSASPAEVALTQRRKKGDQRRGKDWRREYIFRNRKIFSISRSTSYHPNPSFHVTLLLHALLDIIAMMACHLICCCCVSCNLWCWSS